MALPNVIENVSKYIGICEKHWPVGFPKVRKKGADRPLDPPSLFENVPHSYLRQTIASPDRQVKKRKVLNDVRTPMPAVSTPVNADIIVSWDRLITYCQSLDLTLTVNNDYIMLLKINGVPPRVVFSVVIYRDFNVTCFSFNNKIVVRDLLGFRRNYKSIRNLMQSSLN